ncbi:DinB family protein [Georgenia muralis]|uniref:DinB family protein n=1 Tax=Georgenia muralis TaxID=154117 RepID=A0A3N4ZK24_9MICO|nr:DinB family protein [Georgenia muralis]RPF25982.1 DinB family protein [Georgenia muralis]
MDIAPDDAIAPDTKDWTWVLERPCPQCGLDARAVEPEDLGAGLRDLLPRWQSVLGRPDAGERPDAATWSPLEYGCHVRDVCRLMRTRLDAVLRDDDPVFADWDQDAAAAGYAGAGPAAVWRELADAGTDLAAALDALRPEQRDRPGRRSDGATFTATTLGRYALHEVAHHTWDVRG